MEKNKLDSEVLCVICVIMTLLGIAASIVSLIEGSGDFFVSDVICLILSLLVGYYVIYGYKKPHGNLLKYIILLYAASNLLSFYQEAQNGAAWYCVISSVIIGILCYVAGRLNKVKQNTILMIVVAVLNVIRIACLFAVKNYSIGIFTHLIIWLDICATYFLRRKEHKLAGLIENE